MEDMGKIERDEYQLSLRPLRLCVRRGDSRDEHPSKSLFQNWDRLFVLGIGVIISMVSEQKYLIVYAQGNLCALCAFA